MWLKNKSTGRLNRIPKDMQITQKPKREGTEKCK